MPEASFDVAKAQRWFAVELNNLAWDLLEAESRTEAETERMIHAAHGACYHWLQAGALVDQLRAQCLLATMYARLSDAAAALKYAGKCLELSAKASDEQTPFDRATAYGCAALAYDCAQLPDEARGLRQKATNVAATFVDPEDKKVFEQLYVGG